MDESWRKKHPTIHPQRGITSPKNLTPHDFHDVFGGPPRSVLLRHFSSSTRHTHSGFRDPNPSYNPNFNDSNHNDDTGLYKSDHVYTSQFGRNHFFIVKREPDKPYDAVFYNSDHVSEANRAQKGFQAMKKEYETSSSKTSSHKSDHVQAKRYGDNGFRAMKMDDETMSSKTGSQKSDHVSTNQYGNNGFRVMKMEDETMSGKTGSQKSLHASTNRYGHNGFQLMTGSRISDHVSSSPYEHNGFQLRKGDNETSCKDDGYISNEGSSDRGSYGVPLDQGACKGFQITKEEDFVSSYSNFHKSNHTPTTTHYAHNGFQVIKIEKNGFSNEGFIYRISNKNPVDIQFHAFKREDGFYDDIYGSDIRNAGLSRSRSRSVSKSESTGVSCCDVGYYDRDDRDLASLAAKLRPLTIPSRRYDSSISSTISEELTDNSLQFSQTQYPSSPLTRLNHDTYSHNMNNSKITYKTRCSNSSFCCFTPPETDSVGFKKMTSSEDNSPSSVVSSYFPYMEKNVALETDRGQIGNRLNEKGSFVIKMDGFMKLEKERSVGSETSAALDEAIAWAKGKFMNQGEESKGIKDTFDGFRDWNEKNGNNSREGKER